MRPLLVCSLEPLAGKTALSVGLIRRFWKDGLYAAYVKAVTAGPAVDGDAAFVRETLSLPDPLSEMAPIALAEPSLHARHHLKAIVSALAGSRDLVVVEAGSSLAEGARCHVSAAEVARLLDARVILVLRYRTDEVDAAVLAARQFGSRFAGAVVNAVPPSQLAKARDTVHTALERAGVPVLGVVPQDRVLLAVSVREIADRLGAQVLCGEAALDELVERLMIGAMSVDGASVYFRKHPNKAVITGGDRPDVQLAALATPTRCVVLTGGFAVEPRVLARAREVGVPLLLANQDTLEAIETIQDLFNRARFRQKAKIGRLEALVADYVDTEALRAALTSA